MAPNALNSAKSNEYWRYLEENYQEVSKWPLWMRGEKADMAISKSKLGLVEVRDLLVSSFGTCVSESRLGQHVYDNVSLVDLAKHLNALLAARDEQLRAAVLEEAELAFKDAYSDYDDPLIGVMYGLKAIRALALLPPPEGKAKP